MSDAGGTKPNQCDATIGLGSNIGDKAANIDAAIKLLTRDGAIRVVARSRNYRSAPWGVTNQDWFVNAAIAVATELSAHALLLRCQHVENDMGRVRRQRWGPRLIDVDVLTYRDETIREPDLIVPHPLIAERAFVLLPLRDVAPETRIDGRSLNEMISALGDGGTAPLDQ
jgi:2-amino-4-hydroxy-6-hydroxymethyldihydropteridine diphosphokinase